MINHLIIKKKKTKLISKEVSHKMLCENPEGGASQEV